MDTKEIQIGEVPRHRGRSASHRAEARSSRAQSEQSTAPRPPASRKRKLLFGAIGILGEILITIGILLGLFIVWQLWWTNLVGERNQATAVSAIHEEFGKLPPGVGEAHHDAPPAWEKAVGPGEHFGVIHIPAFGYDHQSIIAEGTTKQVLDFGAFGHYTDTAMPGEIGNFSTAVHREVYGARMINVDKLKEGDAIVIETADTWYVYKIISHQIVDPSDIYVVSPDPFRARERIEAGQDYSGIHPTRRLLTITTCHPPGIANKRWIVQAEFDNWVKRSDGKPIELIDPAELAKK